MHLLPISSSPSRFALATLATSAVLLSGCSNMATSFSDASAPISSKAGTVGGHIHGGNQAVAGATVNLYIAGVNGQSTTAATFAATTTSSADGFGSFSFIKDANLSGSSNQHADNHFACPAGATDPYIFVVAHGGSTVNGTTAAPNTDAAFIAPLGPCSSINASTLVNMSEVVTVATMAAIHQFMNPTGSTSGSNGTPIEQSISSDGIFVSSAALTNSFNSVFNMVDITTGLARTTTTIGSINGSTGVQVTITPEIAKINQLANIISSCINYAPSSPGTQNPNCAAIYHAAPQPANTGITSMPGATMNPATDLLTALYYIFTNVNPGATAINSLNSYAGTGPYTPTLSAAPTDWSIGVNYSSTSTCNSGGAFLSSPGSISIDLYGDLWIGNNNPAANTLAQLSHIGIPTSCVTLTPVNGTGATASGASTTIDINKNIYAASLTSSDIYRFAPSANPSTPVDIATSGPAVALASDTAGNLFYTTSAGNLYEIVGANTATTFTSVQINTSPGNFGKSLVIDAHGRIWASSASGNTLTGFFPSTSGNVTTYTATTITTAAPVLAVAVGRSNGGSTPVYTIDGTSSTIARYLANDTTNAITANGSFSSTSAGLATPASLTIDGAGNIWAANTAAMSVSAIDNNGNAVTPMSGLQKAATQVGNNASAIAIDASGNLWIASSPNSVTKIAGGAVPVVVPYSYALQANRFQTIP